MAGHRYVGKRLSLTVIGEETDPEKIKVIRHRNIPTISEEEGKYLVQFHIDGVRSLIGNPVLHSCMLYEMPAASCLSSDADQAIDFGRTPSKIGDGGLRCRAKLFEPKERAWNRLPGSGHSSDWGRTQNGITSVSVTDIASRRSRSRFKPPT